MAEPCQGGLQSKSGEAQVLSKGPVQLALAGGGEGVNLGVDVGAFTISR